MIPIVTILGATFGALLAPGGPVGLAVGVAAGGLIDVLRSGALGGATTTTTAATAAAAATPGTLAALAGKIPAPSPNANVQAAESISLLISAAVHAGHTNPGTSPETGPALSWLGTFQQSVGLPQSGHLDAATAAQLIAIWPAAATLPSSNIIS